MNSSHYRRYANGTCEEPELALEQAKNAVNRALKKVAEAEEGQ